MRLVTYDRGGARRLGAWVDGTVVDLPDAVGHPSFPATMEALVEHNGGTILDAAVEMLAQPDVVDEFSVPNARLLVPFIPRALRSAPEVGAGLAVFGPDDEIPWPDSGWLEFDLEIACVAGKTGWDLDPGDAEWTIFGYTIVNEWWVRPGSDGASGNGKADDPYIGFSFGPCIVTAEEFDPEEASIEVRIDGRVRSAGKLSAVRSTFARLLVQASREGGVSAGDLFGSGRAKVPSPRSWHLRPGTVVDAEAEGVGVLRTHIGSRARALAPR